MQLYYVHCIITQEVNPYSFLNITKFNYKVKLKICSLTVPCIVVCDESSPHGKSLREKYFVCYQIWNK